MVALKCPRCNIDMKKIIKDKVEIDVCKKCRGMWLDDSEIEKLIGGSKR
ncbi:MAG: zf-TFIIB domain-containing protein [Nanoarchaeota archaeon]|nr:zf-TFIIB domain-containing protein [Nanoarchaeota archaeon]